MFNRIAVALLVVALATVSAFGKTEKATINFADDTKVNGTVLKKGTYKVTFDDATGELSILKGNTVVAKTTVRTEPREGKTRSLRFTTIKNANVTELVSIAFKGSAQNLVVADSNMMAAEK